MGEGDTAVGDACCHLRHTQPLSFLQVKKNDNLIKFSLPSAVKTQADYCNHPPLPEACTEALGPTRSRRARRPKTHMKKMETNVVPSNVSTLWFLSGNSESGYIPKTGTPLTRTCVHAGADHRGCCMFDAFIRVLHANVLEVSHLPIPPGTLHLIAL